MMYTTIRAAALIFLLLAAIPAPAQQHDHPLVQTETAMHEAEAHGSGHENAMDPLLFIIVSLIIGAATRHFLRKSPLPYTVLLLLAGLVLGVLNRVGYFTAWHLGPLSVDLGFLDSMLTWAGHIDPHVILFVFLPTLIFEAAFAMDVHTFRKSLVNAVILAVPGIILALLLTAAMAMGIVHLGLGLEQWAWPVSLMFGAVISATDPVAVVSLLKELGASKKLGTLIEGESLLNDGTAIVIFMVFFGVVTHAAGDVSPVLEFSRVALGGTLLGLVIAAITIAWVKKVFNDALVEITVVVAAAYLTFFIAEHFLHVSGVLGLVALGLAMAGVGRTRISPEVMHFLHEFWELAAFFANTLIFLVVGVVVAQRTVFTLNDFFLLAIIYVGIHAVRAVVILVFYPFMKNTGYGLPVKDAWVVWYGALRGAIGLALALIVAGEEGIDREIRDQFLFLTAGIVTLTLLINATTIKALVNRLGLTTMPAAKAVMVSGAIDRLAAGAEEALNVAKGDPFMSGANWAAVRSYLPAHARPAMPEDGLAEADALAEIRRRVLLREKSSCWSQFNEGLLGPVAVRRLNDGISEALDSNGTEPLTERKYLDRLWDATRRLKRSSPLAGALFGGTLFDRLALCHDMARGFVVAQEEAARLVAGMATGGESGAAVATVRDEIGRNRLRGLNFLKDLRNSFPEIGQAIETRHAIRSVLNHERSAIRRLRNEGRLESDEADRMVAGVESRMKMLMDTAPQIRLPEPTALLKEVPWLQGLDEAVFGRVAGLVQTKLHPPGDTLMKQGDAGDSLVLIARGSVRISVKSQLVDIAGPGSVLGEMAALTGRPRTADVVSDTAVTALWLAADSLREIFRQSAELESRMWQTAGKRYAENTLSHRKPYLEWTQMKFRRWINAGHVEAAEGKAGAAWGDMVCVLIDGSAEVRGETVPAPALISVADAVFAGGSRVFLAAKG